MAHSYQALYYPFIHFKDERWLKLTALYWDRMARIAPRSYTRDDSPTVQALGDYIENVPPDWVRPSFGERFIEFIAGKSDELRRHYSTRLKDRWPVVRPAHRPPTAGGSSGTDPRLSYVYFEKMSPGVRTVLRESELAEPDAGDERWIGMHPRLAHVYMTALADQMAAERGLTPITDETHDHVCAGGNTLERLAQALLDDVALVDESATGLETETLAAFVAIESLLPVSIDQLPVEKILDFRERYPQERARFQRCIADFVKPREWLNDMVDPEELGKRLQSDFRTEFKPQLEELREKQRSVGIDTVFGVLTMQVGIPSIVAQGAAVAGVAANPLLAVGAGTALAVVRVLRDRRKATREIAASNVSYMLRLEQDLKPRDVLGWIGEATQRFGFTRRAAAS